MTDDIEDLQQTYPGAGTFKFGDSAELCQRLIKLVRQGKLKARVVPGNGVMVFLRKENPDIVKIIETDKKARAKNKP